MFEQKSRDVEQIRVILSDFEPNCTNINIKYPKTKRGIGDGSIMVMRPKVW